MIEIRGASRQDESALVHLDAVTRTAGVSPAPAPSTGTPFFGERVRPEDVLVAVVDDVVVGYARLGQPIALAAHEHVLEVSGLAVHPDRQRDGIGRRLVEAAVREARERGARKLALRVLEPNTAARRLYEATGFVVEGVLRAEFLVDSAYVDDILMARSLVSESPAGPVAGRDLDLKDGRTVRVYDTGRGDGLALLWHHGSPQTGAPLEPLLSAAAARGIRLLSYGRASYGGSSPHPGRDVAAAAGDVAQIADDLGLARFAVMGASGGGPHALACAALLPDRVVGAVCLAGLAPFTESFDWFAGMVSDGGLRAAVAGREARERYEASTEFDENSFTPADWAALEGAWSSLGADVGRAGAAGPDGLIDDDVAFVAPWGFDVAQIVAPVLLVQGGQDRVVPPAHADWLLRHCRGSELWLRPDDGHISILDACPVAMDWLQTRDQRP